MELNFKNYNEMKRFLILAVALMIALPNFAQKLSKEEKAAQIKALNETAIKAIEENDWAIVPTSYIDSDGIDNQLTDNGIFISYEKTAFFAQGARVCGDSRTLVAEVKDFDKKIDKKGNLKMSFNVQGRYIQGKYQITMRAASGNIADVIFTPTSGTVRKFQGPIVPSKVAGFYKKSSPM